ncbi:uncharacterized protein [Miscanthus floridulus]|uniref:uncharacterized protein n=1 Tax=Miscanthus floridulus TaxID=154761 RepID=UPI0034579CCF
MEEEVEERGTEGTGGREGRGGERGGRDREGEAEEEGEGRRVRERRWWLTRGAERRGAWGGRCVDAAGRAGWPSAGWWGAQGGQARSGRRAAAGCTAPVVEARGDRGAHASVGRAAAGCTAAVVEARGGRGARVAVGRAGRPGSGQPARAAAGARRRGAWNIAM